MKPLKTGDRCPYRDQPIASTNPALRRVLTAIWDIEWSMYVAIRTALLPPEQEATDGKM